jgi:CHAT domain-containing protein
VRFAALGGSGQYLIERNPIALAPTFAIAAGAGPRSSDPLGPAVVLGDPDPRHPLPSARREADEVGTVLGVVPLLGLAADHAAVAAARRAKFLHVASHGSTRDDGTTISLGDGEFGTADVLELGLAPELVVVASCASAATRPDAMWTSIAAAFLVNGATAVVGATASIPDDVARDIVVELHRHSVEVDPVRGLALALRAAIARRVRPKTRKSWRKR